MKDLRGVKEKDKEHYMKCPDCGEWFDMRDLAAVFRHQHEMKEKPGDVRYSHVERIGKPMEFYVYLNKQILTLRLPIRGGNNFPGQRA